MEQEWNLRQDRQTLDPNPASFNEPQAQKDKKGHFSLELDMIKTPKYMKCFKGSKSESKFNDQLEFTTDLRNPQYYDILLKISNDKIGLGSHPIFAQKIKGHMKTVIETNYQRAYSKNPSEANPAIDSAMQLVDEVTKIAHLLMITALSLYNKHETEFLSENKNQ
ncbi:hypothetical protein PCASD_10196, partial [Puccinia coronata f. sp. avenae]